MLFFIEFDPDHFFWTCRFRRSLNPTFTVTTAWWFRGAACATALSEWRTSLGPLKRTGSVSPSPGMGPVGPCWMFGPGHRKATAKCFPSRRFPKSHRGTSRISKSCYFRNFLWSFTIFLPWVLPSSDYWGIPVSNHDYGGNSPWQTPRGHWIGHQVTSSLRAHPLVPGLFELPRFADGEMGPFLIHFMGYKSRVNNLGEQVNGIHKKWCTSGIHGFKP